VIERGQNAKEKSNNWKTLLIAGLNLERPRSSSWNEYRFPTLGAGPLVPIQCHVMAFPALQEVKFGHWAKTVIGF
jgi:hypothetical protein